MQMATKLGWIKYLKLQIKSNINLYWIVKNYTFFISN